MSLILDGLDRAISRFRRMRSRAPSEVDAENKRAAVAVKEQIQRNLSGVEGMPQPRTRQYLNSWSVVKVKGSGSESSYAVVTNSPQSDRLEYGFVGMDSAGRMVHQSPRPHRRPAINTVAKSMKPRYRKAVRRIKA